MSDPTRRLFVSIDPPAAAVDDLAAVVRDLAVSRANKPGASTRVSPPDRWHVTLAFLGEVPSHRIDDAAAALERAAAGRRRGQKAGQQGQDVGERGQAGQQGQDVGERGQAGQQGQVVGQHGEPGGPAMVRFAGGGTFGRGRFTILWARLAGDVDALRALSRSVRRELRRARLPFDDKQFRPHLTLARPGDRVSGEAIAADVARLDAYEGPLWPVEHVHLVESDFVSLPTGVEPHYTHLHTVRLAPWSDRRPD